jgi:hypothetical protein
MRTALLALGILGLCIGGLALADGNEPRLAEYEPAEGHRHARFSIYRVKEGTLMIDGSTGHTWRLEFRDKAGYTWSQVPRGILRDPEFEMSNPVTGE